MRQKRRSYREPDDDEDASGEDLAAVNERLDALTRQLERMAHANAEPRGGAGGTDAARRSRLRRAGAARSPARSGHSREPHRRERIPAARRYAPPPPAPPQFAPAPPPPPPAPSRGPANWAAQISARQRALDGGPAAPPPRRSAQAPANWGGGPDLTGLEQQLHHINTQISSLHQPYENALGALRSDLAEIGRALDRRHAAPGDRGARNRGPRAWPSGSTAPGRPAPMARRSDRSNASSPRFATRSAVSRRPKTWPASKRRCAALSHKIDQIAASGQAPQGDPMAFKQLEQAVVSLRGVVSNVASDGALAQLAAEVRGLGAQFERATADSSTEALAKLEARIASLMESGRAVPPELEGSIRALSERLDRMQLSQGDQLALGALEDRIAKLSEKLDASDSRLGHLDAIERGLADLLVYLEEMRSGGPRGLRAPPAEPAPAPAAPPRPAPEAPAAAPVPAPAFAQSPLDLIPELPPHRRRRAMQCRVRRRQLQPPHVEAFAPPPPAPMPRRTAIRSAAARAANAARTAAPADRSQSAARHAARTWQRRAAHETGSAAARIAASEAALGHARPMATETGGKSAAIAAARNAAKAAYLDTPVKVPKSLGRKPRTWLKWPFKKAAKDLPAEPRSMRRRRRPRCRRCPRRRRHRRCLRRCRPRCRSTTTPTTAFARQEDPQAPEDTADRSQRRHHRRRRGADRDGVPVLGRRRRPPVDAAQGPIPDPAAPARRPPRDHAEPADAGAGRHVATAAPAADPEPTNSINGGSLVL